MIELIGIFLLAGTLTSVAVINAIHRPFEMRSEDPNDFDMTALDGYNRLLAALSTGKIKNHHFQLKETVDPLYFVAALSYADEIGNTCEALVTLDVVEGYKSTTTIRWTCKFLKWCEKTDGASSQEFARPVDYRLPWGTDRIADEGSKCERYSAGRIARWDPAGTGNTSTVG